MGRSKAEQAQLEHLGANVRRRREKLGLTQEDLAEDAGLGRIYVHRMERGIANPSICVLVRVAKALDTTVPQLLRRTRRPKRPHGRPRKKKSSR